LEKPSKIKLNNRVLVDCSQITKTPRGMGLYTLDLVRALNRKCALVLVFQSNSANRKLVQTLNLEARTIFLPLQQPIIEQFIIPILIVLFRVETYVSAGDSISIIGSRLCSAKLLLHDIYFTKKIDLTDYSLKRRLARIYRRLTVTAAINSCEAIITVSSYMKEQITQRYTAVDQNKIQIISNVLRYKKEKCEKKNCSVLLVTGSDPQKNASWAIQELLKLSHYIDEIYIAGIEEASDIGLSASPNVRYLGFQSQSKLEKYYEECYLLILPSLEESFGVPLIEALSKNCRVCASRTGALPEIGGDFVNYFNLHDTNSFSRALHTALGQTHNWRLLSEYLEAFEQNAVSKKVREMIL
jgi:glycosyltransferase involved in cell wall biosynthesis